MLYKRNEEKVLDEALFRNPTSEYRGAPFWAWNCKMNKEMLCEQIEAMKKMGFGGFHMHSRTGMNHKYLSDEFMNLVGACVDKAKEENMLAWLYDEDRYPSGFAGGFVTKNKRYRERPLIFTKNKMENVDFDKDLSVENDSYYFVGAYDICLNDKGEITEYKKIGFDDEGANKWYAYLKSKEPDAWFNNCGYIDAMCGEAVDEFIKVTHERYKECFGNEFGKTIPAIFTDEPNFGRMWCMKFANGSDDGIMVWTLDFDQTFEEKYEFNIIDRIPELFWNLKDNKMSVARYLYHCHLNERFAEAFTDKIGKWCDENNIYLTGHVLDEESMFRQTTCIGEAMPLYRGFNIPGIDILCDRIELTTAKQCQSVVHQYGREGMLSELYGVTGWQFDFRGHKFQGDWQAALGVTVRVPHLSWVSMEGRAKRDYPASFNYQSPWYEEYSYLENHYARLNTVLTRGKPVVNVGVIHPIETYWVNYGPNDTTGMTRTDLDDNFESMIECLLFGTIDFDFISESMLPELCGAVGRSLEVGAMKYDTIIVCGSMTLRQTTADILKKFRENGGKVIFVGSIPEYVGAKHSDEVKKLSESCERVAFSKTEILTALAGDRIVSLNDEDGEASRKFIYNLRQDGDIRWLFIAHGVKGDEIRIFTHNSAKTCPDVSNGQRVIIKVKGQWKPVIYDTLSGEKMEIAYRIENGQTVFENVFYANDSLLVRLEETDILEFNGDDNCLSKIKEKICVTKAEVMREEPNVYMLDTCEFALDDNEFESEEEIIRIDNICRERLSIPKRTDVTAQPWILPDEEPKHTITMRFKVNSATEIQDTLLAIERPKETELWFNDKVIEVQEIGYFTDKSIKTIKMPKINAGENTLIVKMPFAEKTNLEWLYVLGEFDVKLVGTEKTIVPIDDNKGFGKVQYMGMPFYGGSLIYKSEFKTNANGDAYIRVGGFRGPVIKVFVDGKAVGIVAIQPYNIKVKGLNAGKHTIELKLYGNRCNSFNALHNANTDHYWNGAIQWETEGEQWSYEYNLFDFGILHGPVIEIR